MFAVSAFVVSIGGHVQRSAAHVNENEKCRAGADPGFFKRGSILGLQAKKKGGV